MLAFKINGIIENRIIIAMKLSSKVTFFSICDRRLVQLEQRFCWLGVEWTVRSSPRQNNERFNAGNHARRSTCGLTLKLFSITFFTMYNCTFFQWFNCKKLGSPLSKAWAKILKTTWGRKYKLTSLDLFVQIAFQKSDARLLPVILRITQPWNLSSILSLQAQSCSDNTYNSLLLASSTTLLS
jgi:hypothetical protein